MSGLRGFVLAATGCVAVAPCLAGEVVAQSLPAVTRVSLERDGHESLAERLTKRMEPRSKLDRRDVEDLLERWEKADRGPSDSWDWLTVARLWLRAGDADAAREALERTGEDLPEGLRLLDRARIGFLAGESDAAIHYWAACNVADEASALEAWRDVEVLATPAEVAAWDRFRRLPAGQRDDCAFLRRFWNERASRSGLSTDERVVVHYERLRHATKYYLRRGRAQDVAASGKLNARLGREGAPQFDDRGLLYLRLGPPDETAAVIGGDCYEPNVSWFYRLPDGNRMYHLSPLGGNDNWWLLGNIAEVFRCSVDITGNVVADRNPMVSLSPILRDIPAGILRDIYISRAQLDPRYARFAYSADNLHKVEMFQDERDLTWADGEYVVQTIGERPDVRFDLPMAIEWLEFRLPVPDRTRVWLLLAIPGESLADIEPEDAETLELVVTATSSDGERMERVSRRLSKPESGQGMVARLPIELPPGGYTGRVVVRAGPPRGVDSDASRPPSGGFAEVELNVREFGGSLPRLSEVAISPDSGGTWAQAPRLGLSPSPLHVTNEDGKAWIYFEAYNLTPDGRYEANVRLEPEDGGRPFDLSYGGIAATGGRVVTRSVLRLDLDTTPPGPYRLSLTVRDLATGRTTLPARTGITVHRGP